MTKQKIAVIGMGYVGIPVAVMLAATGNYDVVGIEKGARNSHEKIEMLAHGELPIKGKEPNLPELLAKVIADGSITFTEDYSAVKGAHAVFINVQTPADRQGRPIYTALESASRDLGRNLEAGTLVVLESTVAPGTTEHVVKPILEKESGMKCPGEFYLAFSYERVMVGRLLHNLQKYPRIVGGINDESTNRAMDIYRGFIEAELIPTNILTAEVAKTVENTYRDVNIAFANEVALICESLGIDAFEVRRMVNSLPIDSNAYRDLHIPGAGVGGHCLPKDPWLLKYGMERYGLMDFPLDVIVASRKKNNYMPYHMVELLSHAFEHLSITPQNAKVAVLGLSFLPESDDVRHSPTLPTMEELSRLNVYVVGHDPYVKEFPPVEVVGSIEEAIKDADAVMIMTGHCAFKEFDIGRYKELMRTPIIIDGRNCYRKEVVEEMGMVYLGIGKPITVGEKMRSILKR